MQAHVRRFVIAVFSMAILMALPSVQSFAGEIRPATGQGIVVFQPREKSTPEPDKKRRVTTATSSGIVAFQCPDGSKPVDGSCEKPAPRIVISPRVLPDGEIDNDYRSGETPVQLSAKGGTVPYRFQRSKGNIPRGLRLSAGGRISGTPMKAGKFSFTVRAFDKNDYSGERAYTILVTQECDWPKRMVNAVCMPPPKITLLPRSLPAGEVDYDYRMGEAPAQLRATGGREPYRFRVKKGQLPPGLRMSSQGRISGSPVEAGRFSFTARAKDKNGYPGERAYTIVVEPPPCDWPKRIVDGVCKEPRKITLSPRSVPPGTVDVDYPAEGDVVQFSASGGQEPYRFRVRKGRLPPGLRLSSDGQLAGLPVRKGAFRFSVRATDKSGIRGSRSYKVVIREQKIDEECYPPRVLRNGVCSSPPPRISIAPSELRGGDVKKSYPPVQFVANGGQPPHQFSVAGGSLPPGLRMSASGLLSGVPTSASAFGFTIQATDRNKYSGRRAYSVTILEQICVPPMVLMGDECAMPRIITISPAELPGYSTGDSYPEVQLVANGGARPYTFDLASGSLPPGLSMSSSGLINGIPVKDGAFSFVVRASDALDFASQRTYSITIKKEEEPCPPGQVRFGANCEPSGETAPPKIVKKVPNRECRSGQYRNDEGRCVWESCGRGKARNNRGVCVTTNCGRGKYRTDGGKCVWKSCGRSKYRNNRGKCVLEKCGRGKYRNNRGKCVLESCGRGKYRNNRGKCVWERCNRGYSRNNRGQCVRVRCPRGTFRRGGDCVRVRCNQHYVPNNQGRCVLSPFCVGKQIGCAFKKNHRWIAPCRCQRQYREQPRYNPEGRERRYD
jgi:uncharacterized low-complexity protein